MEKILYEDQVYTLKRITTETGEQTFLTHQESEGQMVLVLPFRKTMGKFSYLINRELVSGWDQHPDICGITIPVKYQPEVSAVHRLKELTGVEFNQKKLIHIGVCAASKNSGDTYFLFGLDLTHNEDDLTVGSLEWVDEKTVAESLDSQLIAALTRLKYVV